MCEEQSQDFPKLSSDIRSQIKKGNVKVVGAVYDLRTGSVEWFPDQRGPNSLNEISLMPAQISDIAPSEKRI